MTAFDYVLLFLLVGFMLISMTKGLVREVISLVSWVVAFYVATHYGDILIPWLPSAVSGDVMRMIVAFIVLFMHFDRYRQLGTTTPRDYAALFARIAKGALVALALVLVCGMTKIPEQPFWKNAMFSPMAVQAAKMTMPYLPDYFVEYIHF